MVVRVCEAFNGVETQTKACAFISVRSIYIHDGCKPLPSVPMNHLVCICDSSKPCPLVPVNHLICICDSSKPLPSVPMNHLVCLYDSSKLHPSVPVNQVGSLIGLRALGVV